MASLLIVASALARCGSQLLTDPDGSTGDAASDVEVTDSSSDVASIDAATDADAEAGVTFTYSDWDDPNNWESFDVYAFTGQPDLQFLGGAWDGHYVYYIPHGGNNPSGLLVRYDTTLPFTSSSSWEKFDMMTADSTRYGYAGAVFAKNALYLIPSYAGSAAARFDTTGAFTSSGSYQSFDTSTATPLPLRYFGGAFDGQFIYPAAAAGFFSTTFEAARYDTTQSFTSKNSWQQVTLGSSANANDRVLGALFDGKYVYYAPNQSPVFRRFDITHAFTDMSGWEEFTAGPPMNGNSYRGSAFDGRYAYFVGFGAQPQFNVVVTLLLTRYDTQKPFTAATSWSYIPTGTDSKNGRWVGTIFDGRYVFLIPSLSSAFPGMQLGRYDTKSAAYDDAGAPGFDTNYFSVPAQVPVTSSYAGGAYDGQYLYLVPQTGPAVRFKTKTPAKMPASYYGSFL